ncbi:MAG: hypothetical protein CBARDCOR_2648 [uncultured Caballeronia sp.]|nr:MAG: hypothetical protein CBARDCOR_2648 [uncultured Caballeronia sp.]
MKERLPVSGSRFYIKVSLYSEPPRDVDPDCRDLKHWVDKHMASIPPTAASPPEPPPVTEAMARAPVVLANESRADIGADADWIRGFVRHSADGNAAR